MKALCLAILVSFASLAAVAQRDVFENSKLGERLYFGGGLGLNGGTDSYGNRYFYVGVYPIIGYMVTSQFSTGLGITYQYYSYPDYDQEIHQYGVSPFLRYNFGQLFLYGEYSLINTPVYSINSGVRKTYDRLLLGAGWSQPIGGRASLNVMGLYDVIWNRSEYAFASPWVLRVFVSF